NPDHLPHAGVSYHGEPDEIQPRAPHGSARKGRRGGDRETRRGGDRERTRQYPIAFLTFKTCTTLIHRTDSHSPVSLSPSLLVSQSPCLPVSLSTLSPCLPVSLTTLSGCRESSPESPALIRPGSPDDGCRNSPPAPIRRIAERIAADCEPLPPMCR